MKIVHLPYRPPYDWSMMHNFLAARLVASLEWKTDHSYGRTFRHGDAKGAFTAKHEPEKNRFEVELLFDDATTLELVCANIRRMLDLDTDSQAVDTFLKEALGPAFPFQSGTRLPGIWDIFEAGIRAILGQQISVKAAHTYCGQLVGALGEPVGKQKPDYKFFPTPEAIAASDLDFMKMPQAKKDTLRRFAAYLADDGNDHDPESWINLKGIGKWTVQYAQMRGQSHPDIYMGGDLGIIKMQDTLPDGFSDDDASPWRSYLTLQLWRQL